MEEIRNCYKIMAGKFKIKRPLEILRRTLKDDIKKGRKKIRWTWFRFD
jgi:hypothetical protein